MKNTFNYNNSFIKMGNRLFGSQKEGHHSSLSSIFCQNSHNILTRKNYACYDLNPVEFSQNVLSN